MSEKYSVIPLPLDVTGEESIEEAYNAVRGYTYRLDAVVNFAGIHTFTSMVEGDCVHEIEKMLNVNVMGMERVNKRFFEMVRIGETMQTLLSEGNIPQIAEAIASSKIRSMIPFDQSLVNLFRSQRISYDTAIKYALDRNRVRRQLH